MGHQTRMSNGSSNQPDPMSHRTSNNPLPPMGHQMTQSHGTSNPNNPWDIDQNCPKNDPKCPKNVPKCPKNDPKFSQSGGTPESGPEPPILPTDRECRNLDPKCLFFGKKLEN